MVLAEVVLAVKLPLCISSSNLLFGFTYIIHDFERIKAFKNGQTVPCWSAALFHKTIFGDPFRRWLTTERH